MEQLRGLGFEVEVVDSLEKAAVLAQSGGGADAYA
jgi:hypothetical protein